MVDSYHRDDSDRSQDRPGRYFQQLRYNYDLVGNVTQMASLSAVALHSFADEKTLRAVRLIPSLVVAAILLMAGFVAGHRPREVLASIGCCVIMFLITYFGTRR